MTEIQQSAPDAKATQQKTSQIDEIQPEDAEVTKLNEKASQQEEGTITNPKSTLIANQIVLLSYLQAFQSTHIEKSTVGISCKKEQEASTTDQPMQSEDAPAKSDQNTAANEPHNLPSVAQSEIVVESACSQSITPAKAPDAPVLNFPVQLIDLPVRMVMVKDTIYKQALAAQIFQRLSDDTAKTEKKDKKEKSSKLLQDLTEIFSSDFFDFICQFQPSSLQHFFNLIEKEDIECAPSVIQKSKECEDYEQIMAQYGHFIFAEVAHCKRISHMIEWRLKRNYIEDQECAKALAEEARQEALEAAKQPENPEQEPVQETKPETNPESKPEDADKQQKETQEQIVENRSSQQEQEEEKAEEMSVDLDVDELAECLQDAEVEMQLEKDQREEAEKLEAQKKLEEQQRLEAEQQRQLIEQKQRQADELELNRSMQSSDDIDCGGLID